MLRYNNYNIVFQEIPGEVTLAVNLSGCINHCPGCHSPWLQENTGEFLNKQNLLDLLNKYGNAITCFCFMGGDNDPQEVEKLSAFIREQTKIKTGWYSGKPSLPENIAPENFNYIKLGPYIEELGGLNQPTTNQRFYRIENGKMIDCTYLFLSDSKTIGVRS